MPFQMKSMKSILLSAVCAALLLTPALADAQDSDYFAVRGGWGGASDVDRSAGTRTATIEFGHAYGLSAAYGRQVSPWLRLEGEFSCIEAKVDEIKGHFGQETAESGRDRFYGMMINAFADLNNSTDFTPFAGLGIGPVYAHHDVTFSPFPGKAVARSDHHDWVFGYQLMAGVAWDINSRFSMDIMYRFMGMDSRDHQQDNVLFRDVDVDPSHIHMLEVGLRFPF